MGGFNFISIEDIDSDWVVHGVHVCWITTDGNILLWLKLQHQQLQKVERGLEVMFVAAKAQQHGQ